MSESKKRKLEELEDGKATKRSALWMISLMLGKAGELGPTKDDELAFYVGSQPISVQKILNLVNEEGSKDTFSIPTSVFTTYSEARAQRQQALPSLLEGPKTVAQQITCLADLVDLLARDDRLVGNPRQRLLSLVRDLTGINDRQATKSLPQGCQNDLGRIRAHVTKPSRTIPGQPQPPQKINPPRLNGNGPTLTREESSELRNKILEDEVALMLPGN